jgi:hypothetical protein
VEAADGLAETYRAQGNEAAATALFERLSLVERVLPWGAASPPDEAGPGPPRRCQPPGWAAAEGASAVLATLPRSFRECYYRALRQDPRMKGSFRMIATIGATGEVVRVRTLTPAHYAAAMVGCPMQRLLEARFAPPEGGRATLVVPLTFTAH